MSGIRLVFVSNESAPGAHPDVHSALDRLKLEGLVSDLRIVPYGALLASGLGDAYVVEQVEEAAQVIGADAVIWSHTGRFALGAEEAQRLRALVRVMAYYDGDWYQPPYKRFPRAAEGIARLCDIAFVPGEGWFSGRLRGLGVERIRYVPQTTDERFALSARASTPDWDVVVVGSRVRSRVPWRNMPGAIWREQVVRALHRRFGSRLAVFGTGWTGPFAMGPVGFDRQVSVLSRAVATVGVNNLHARYCFSNRLPIALSSGCAVAYNLEDGIRRVIPDGVGVEWFDSTDGAVAAAERLVSGSGVGDRTAAAGFANANLSMLSAQRYMSSCLSALVRRSPLPPNPWLDSADPRSDSS